MIKKNKIKVIVACIMAMSLGLVGGCTMGKSDEYTQITNDNIDKNKYYTNPQNIDLIADPYVLQGEDGYYYAFGTSDKIQASGYLCWKSEDMINWEETGVAYMATRENWGAKNFWAPEVYFHNGKYYMYYTAEGKETKRLGLGVAVSDKPEGPYKDITDKPIIGEDYSVIDANLIFEEDGRKYLYYVKDCSTNKVNGRNTSQIYGVELNDDMVTFKGEPQLLITPDKVWEMESGDWLWNEGPLVLKNNGKYYLMYSANFYGDKMYSLGYAVSDSPLGPFTKSDDGPVLASEKEWEHVSGPGHNGVSASKDGKELYCVYHTHMSVEDGGHRRAINIDKMGFREDGSMYINGPSVTPQPLPSGLSETINLVESIASIEVKGKGDSTVDLLKDGQVTYHDYQSKYNWNGSGKVEIKINLKEAVKLSDILVYGENSELSPDIKSIELSSGEKFSGFLKPELPGEATIISFEEKEVEWINIVIKNSGDFALSEIMLLGKK